MQCFEEKEAKEIIMVKTSSYNTPVLNGFKKLVYSYMQINNICLKRPL